jgi:hypothetical protein
MTMSLSQQNWPTPRGLNRPWSRRSQYQHPARAQLPPPRLEANREAARAGQGRLVR